MILYKIRHGILLLNVHNLEKLNLFLTTGSVITVTTADNFEYLCYLPIKKFRFTLMMFSEMAVKHFLIIET